MGEISYFLQKNADFQLKFKKSQFFYRNICTSQNKWLTLHSQNGRDTNNPASRHNDSVAQLVEQMTLNHWVVGSSPTGVTKGSIRPMNSSENQ